MIFQTRISVANYQTENPKVAALIKDINAAGSAVALDSILDTLWQPNGLDVKGWEKFLEEHDAHIRAKFIIKKENE